jgi:Polysaccharide deacetylase
MYFIIFSLIALFIGLQTMYFIPEPQGIRVLMYHKVSMDKTDFLTVSVAQLESQLKYLQNLDFQYITSQQLLDFYLENKPLPPKSLLLSFDDAYLNNLEFAYPILKKYRAKATIFVATNFVGKTNIWDNGNDPIMSLAQLKNLDPSVFELALHTHTHPNFKNMPLDRIEKEVQQNIAFFTENGIAFTPALAYPYGGRPKGKAFFLMVDIFEKYGIKAAFRIGNAVNSFKIKDLYELKRIDIRGTDSFEDFKKKVRKGRVKLF